MLASSIEQEINSKTEKSQIENVLELANMVKFKENIKINENQVINLLYILWRCSM